jgi:hypothetical protein
MITTRRSISTTTALYSNGLAADNFLIGTTRRAPKSAVARPRLKKYVNIQYIREPLKLEL